MIKPLEVSNGRGSKGEGGREGRVRGREGKERVGGRVRGKCWWDMWRAGEVEGGS